MEALFLIVFIATAADGTAGRYASSGYVTKDVCERKIREDGPMVERMLKAHTGLEVKAVGHCEPKETSL